MTSAAGPGASRQRKSLRDQSCHETLSHQSEQMSGNGGFLKKKPRIPACLAGSRRRDVAAMATRRFPEPTYMFTLVDRGADLLLAWDGGSAQGRSATPRGGQSFLRIDRVRKRGCPQAYFNGNKIVDVCSRQGWEDGQTLTSELCICWRDGLTEFGLEQTMLGF